LSLALSLRPFPRKRFDGAFRIQRDQALSQLQYYTALLESERVYSLTHVEGETLEWDLFRVDSKVQLAQTSYSSYLKLLHSASFLLANQALKGSHLDSQTSRLRL